MNTRVRVMKPIHGYEFLEAIEAESNIFKKQALLKEYGAKSPLNWLLSLNYDHTIKLDLPEGMPPLELKHMDQASNPDFMGLLSTEIVKLKYCTVKSGLKQKKKEQMFYDLLINCPMKDAEIVCSAKDHALEELYPSITAELVASVFPTYVKPA